MNSNSQSRPGICALVNGQHDRKHSGKIGCGLQEDPSLVEGFLDEFPLLVVELENGLLEVSDASMYKFCGLGRSA